MRDAKAVLAAVVNDCRAYWSDYFEAGLVAGAVLAFLYCLILLYRFICLKNIVKTSTFDACIKIPFVALLGLYCYMVLGVTVLSRTKEAVYFFRLVPFSTWGTDTMSLKFWVENILMMIPFGILLYVLWMPFRKIYWSLFAGGLFSLIIESIQLFTRLGKFETDDIINNIFGTLIGFLLCKGAEYISGSFLAYERKRKMKEFRAMKQHF